MKTGLSVVSFRQFVESKHIFFERTMPEHKILVLGEHARGSEHGRERAMNIACGVVIAIVIVAMIVATVVYFCVGKGGGYGVDATDQSGVGAKKVTEVKAMKQDSRLLPGRQPHASAFGQVPTQPAPRVDGPLFPRLSAEDERELAKTHQLAAVKNYAQGQQNAILTDPKYAMHHDKPPIFRTADFFPYRGKEDERMYQVQTDQVRRHKTPFNQTDDYHSLHERGVRPEFT